MIKCSSSKRPPLASSCIPLWVSLNAPFPCFKVTFACLVWWLTHYTVIIWTNISTFSSALWQLSAKVHEPNTVPGAKLLLGNYLLDEQSELTFSSNGNVAATHDTFNEKTNFPFRMICLSVLFTCRIMSGIKGEQFFLFILKIALFLLSYFYFFFTIGQQDQNLLLIIPTTCWNTCRWEGVSCPNNYARGNGAHSHDRGGNAWTSKGRCQLVMYIVVQLKHN